jgi:hypothetical protein
VVHLSSRYLNAADVGAMSTYLLGDKPPAPQPLKPANADAGAMATGRQHYLAVCAGATDAKAKASLTSRWRCLAIRRCVMRIRAT